MRSQCSNRKQQQCYISQLNKTGKNKNSNWIANVSGNNCPSQLCLQVAWHSAILAWHISSTENDLGPPKHSAKKHWQQQHLLMSWESKLAVDLLRSERRVYYTSYTNVLKSKLTVGLLSFRKAWFTGTNWYIIFDRWQIYMFCTNIWNIQIYIYLTFKCLQI